MREPQFYAQIGYENCGYMPPPLSSKDTYPEYIHEEVMDSVRKIQEHQNADTVTFAFMTDLHYYTRNENHDIRMKRTLNAYKEIAARVHIDKLMLGGDYTNEGCKEYKSECFRELRAQFRGLTYYPVHGNHDDGTIWDWSYLKAEKSVNHLTHEELYRLFYNHLPAAGARFDEKNHALYYYVDDQPTKTRYICLDSGDIPYVFDENGKLLYDGQHHFAMGQKQVDWLVKEALHFEEEGWSVLFFLHSVAIPGKTPEELGIIRKHMTVFNDILELYVQSGKADCDYYEGYFKVQLEADFTKGIKAEILGCLVGDYHEDKVFYSPSGIPYILTGNCVMYHSANAVNKRNDGDKTELLFDIVTVNKEEKRFYITRVGVGEDRIVECLLLG